MRFSFLGRTMLAMGVLCLGTSISEAGFRHHHHHRLRQGGCSDPCQTASAWGGVSYNSAYSPGYASGYGVYAGGPAVQTYGAQCAPTFGAPAYRAPAYSAPAYSAPYAPAYSAPSYSVQGYSAPCAPAIGMAAMSGAGMSSSVASGINQMATVDLGPMTMYKVVLEPQVTTESRIVNSTEYRDEQRTRARVVQRTQPVQFEDYRTRTVLVPKTETKTIEYSVLVPNTSEKTVEVVESVPVWKEVQQNYTVKVPVLSDVQEEYEVRVAQLQDQEFTYTVYVPHAETQTRMQTVTNAVPVTKSRTVTVNVPVARTQTVTKDYGHWETRVEEVTVQSAVSYSVPVSSGPAYAPAVQSCGAPSGGYGMGGCSPCASASAGRHHGLIGKLLHHHRGGHGSCGQCGGASGCSACGGGAAVYASDAAYGGTVGAGCGMSTTQVIQSVPTTQMVSRQVWVPNVVTEDVSVVENVPQSQEITYTVYEQHSEQVPYEATSVCYRPESRTGTRKVVNYVPEKRTRTRKVVNYQDETRTRTLRQASYEQKTRTETVPVVSYTTEKRTKEVSYTVNVPETQVEPFTATRYETVEEVVNETYTERVAVPVSKEVQVQVTRMVPKLVAFQVNISASCASGTSMPVNGGYAPGCGTAAPGYGSGYGSGCGCSGGAVIGTGTAIGGCSSCGVSVGCPNCR